MSIIIFTQIIIAIILLIFGWAIRKKQAYWLISGFMTRPKVEQEELIKNGSPQKTGALFIATAIGMLLLLPLVFTPFQYAVEIQFAFMLVFLMSGLIYLSKYEIPQKRKRSYTISISIFVVLIGIIGYTTFLGYGNYDLKITDNRFEITGMYGDKWKLEDIKEIKLLEKMPEVTSKQNGFGTSTMAKGAFKVKGYGSSLLFVRRGYSPILYIEMEKKKIFINSKDSEVVKAWYDQLVDHDGLPK
ncbi:DUF3784 domain-containing protein [Bacillus sp. CGMCC 1.16607]|uniref:DUF3784 domain-containing protein n=1 Tax=Bacillus sp. CGMCC 1.16607 TaxID=3351842 RepID=UPI00362C189E